MTITLQTTTEIVDSSWQITFQVISDGTMPVDIFSYENTGLVGSGLGEYQAVCTLDDYNRFQTHVPGVHIPIFGNKFLKYNIGVKILDIDVTPKLFISRLVKDVKAFKVAYLAGNSSTSTTII